MIYKLNLSNKESITLSQEEFIKFKENISSNFIEFEAGVVNPSFVVSVIIDEELSLEDNNERLKLMNKSLIGSGFLDELKKVYGKEELRSIKEASRLIESKITKITKNKDE